MNKNTLKLTCNKHSAEIVALLLRSISGNSHPNTLNSCCQNCLMEIPSSQREGISCIYVQDLNTFFRNLASSKNGIQLSDQSIGKEDKMIIEPDKNIFTDLITLCRNIFLSENEKFQRYTEEFLLSRIQNLIRPYEQNLSLVQRKKIMLGDSDFSFECCAFVPHKSYVFIGNREGELFVIDYHSKELIKEFTCPQRIGAVKYIPEKNTVVVSGLRKYILKINVETLEIIKPMRYGQTNDYQNFIVIEYLRKHNLLLLGGFNVNNSLELFNYNDLSPARTFRFKTSSRTRSDELWVSMLIESSQLLLLGYRSGTLQIMRANTLELANSTQTSDHVYALEYLQEKKFIYSGHLNGIIQIWTMKKDVLQKLKFINTGSLTINKIRFLKAPYSKYLIVSNYSKTINVWDYLGHQVDELNIFESPSRAILVLENGIFLCNGATPGAVYFVEVLPGKNFKFKKETDDYFVNLTHQEIMDQEKELCII